MQYDLYAVLDVSIINQSTSCSGSRTQGPDVNVRLVVSVDVVLLAFENTTFLIWGAHRAWKVISHYHHASICWSLSLPPRLPRKGRRVNFDVTVRARVEYLSIILHE